MIDINLCPNIMIFNMYMYIYINSQTTNVLNCFISSSNFTIDYFISSIYFHCCITFVSL